MVTSTERLDVALAQRNQDGADQQSFATLAQELMPDLYRYAFWLSRDPALAEVGQHFPNLLFDLGLIHT